MTANVSFRALLTRESYTLEEARNVLYKHVDPTIVDEVVSRMKGTLGYRGKMIDFAARHLADGIQAAAQKKPPVELTSVAAASTPKSGKRKKEERQPLLNGREVTSYSDNGRVSGLDTLTKPQKVKNVFLCCFCFNANSAD